MHITSNVRHGVHRLANCTCHTQDVLMMESLTTKHASFLDWQSSTDNNLIAMKPDFNHMCIHIPIITQHNHGNHLGLMSLLFFVHLRRPWAQECVQMQSHSHLWLPGNVCKYTPMGAQRCTQPSPNSGEIQVRFQVRLCFFVFYNIKLKW